MYSYDRTAAWAKKAPLTPDMMEEPVTKKSLIVMDGDDIDTMNMVVEEGETPLSVLKIWAKRYQKNAKVLKLSKGKNPTEVIAKVDMDGDVFDVTVTLAPSR